MDTILAIISGVVVYILGQVLQEIWLFPLQQYKKLKSDISFNLMYYSKVFTKIISENDNNNELIIQHNNAALELRKLGCQLRGFLETIYWFHIGIPKKKKLSSASKELIDLSDGMFYKGDIDSVDSEGISAVDELIEMNLQSAINVRSLLGLYTQRKA